MMRKISDELDLQFKIQFLVLWDLLERKNLRSLNSKFLMALSAALIQSSLKTLQKANALAHPTPINSFIIA